MSNKTRPAQYADQRGAILNGFDRLPILCATTAVPSDTTAGYGKGCILLDTDASAGAIAFLNEGTTASCDFNQIVTAGATVAALTVTTLNASAVAFAAAGTVTLPANTTLALTAGDGTTTMLTVDTRNTIADVNAFLFQAAATTIATAAAAHLNPTVRVAAKTITYTGTNTVTSSLGAQLYLGIPPFTDASAGTLSLASTMHVSAVAAAGGSLTLTAARMISTGVADCYLTNAGVWTDTACWAAMKDGVARGGKKAASAVEQVLAALVPATWTYRGTYTAENHVQGPDGAVAVEPMALPLDDFGRERVGIVYDDLPDALRAPGERKGVSAGLLASFCLAALAYFRDETAALKERVRRLEAAA